MVALGKLRTHLLLRDFCYFWNQILFQNCLLNTSLFFLNSCPYPKGKKPNSYCVMPVSLVSLATQLLAPFSEIAQLQTAASREVIQPLAPAPPMPDLYCRRNTIGTHGPYLWGSLLSLGFPDSSVGKESACNAGDPGLSPGWGRSAFSLGTFDGLTWGVTRKWEQGNITHY